MAYVKSNPKSRAALVRSIADGNVEMVFQPGPFPLSLNADQCVGIEGPHYPKPHAWYGTAYCTPEGRIIDVLCDGRSLVEAELRRRKKA